MNFNNIKEIKLPIQIPSEYKRVEYLQSNNLQYIDLGIYGGGSRGTNNLTGFIVKVSGQQTGTENCILGALSGQYYDHSYYLVGATNHSRIALREGYTEITVSNGYSANGEYYLIYNEATGKLMTFDSNYAEKSTSSLLGGEETQYPMYLFGANSSGTATSFLNIKIHSCKISKNGIIVRDMLPVLRVADNKPGMYDLISKQFFVNQSQGSDFLYGNEVSDDYVVCRITDNNGIVLWSDTSPFSLIYSGETNSHYSGSGGDCLFDNSLSTKWCANLVNGMKVYFRADRFITPKSYSLTTGGDTASYPGRNPYTWKLYGKASLEDDYTLIDSRTNDNTMGAYNDRQYDFNINNSNNDYYKYFYYEVNAVQSGSIVQLDELNISESSVS